MPRKYVAALLTGAALMTTALWVVGVHLWPENERLHRAAETVPILLVLLVGGYTLYAWSLSRRLGATVAEAREARRQARASDAMLGAVVRTSGDSVITSDDHGVIEAYNEAAEAMFGYSAEEAVGQNVRLLMPTDYAADHDSHISRFRDTGEGRVVGIGREVVGRRKDGSHFPVHLRLSEIDLPGESGYAAILRDISDIVDARQALVESEEASRRMLNAVPEHVIRYRADGLILDFLPGGAADSPEDFIGRHIDEAFGAGPAKQLQTCIERCFRTGKVESEEYCVVFEDGPRYYESRHVAIAEDEILQISRDVTERRQMQADLEALNADIELRVEERTAELAREVADRTHAEDAARASEMRFRELAENIPQAYWIVDPASGEFLYVSSRYQEVTGHAPATPWEDIVHPDDFEIAGESKQLQHRGELEYTEYRIVRRDGAVRWVGDRVLSTRDSGGAPTRLYGVLEDITDRRESEQLRSVVYDIAEIAHGAADPISMYNAIHSILQRVIDAPEFGIALTTDEPDTFDLVYHGCAEAYGAGPRTTAPLSRPAAVVKARAPIYFTAAQSRALVGDEGYDLAGSSAGAWLGVPLVLDGRLLGIARVLHPTDPDPYTDRDIEIMTYVGRQIALAIDRRRTQERLAEEEQLFQALMDNAPMPIYFKDVDHKFMRVNRVCAESLGEKRPEDVIGRSDSDFMSVGAANSWGTPEDELFRTGKPTIGHIHKDTGPGRDDTWTHITKVPIFDGDGKASLLLGMNQDVTPLMEAQRSLEDTERERTLLMQRLVTVQEEERARIARELHDQVGQELTSLLLELRVLEASPTWEVAKQRASEMRALAAGTLEDVRRIAFEMRPAALDDVGVVAALRRDVEVLSKNASFDATFHVHNADDLRLSGDADLVLYRVVHAAMTNIVRHAQAENVSVVIQALEKAALVMVGDDGVGFDVDAVMNGPVEGKFGLLAMRERVAPVNGTVTIEAAPGEGSTVFIEIPYEAAPTDGQDVVT